MLFERNNAGLQFAPDKVAGKGEAFAIVGASRALLFNLFGIGGIAVPAASK